MSAPACTCEVEIDMNRREARVILCPLHVAAKDLYAVLSEMVRVVDGTLQGYGILAAPMEAARAALAKARGETT